jgi:hypothetical protein
MAHGIKKGNLDSKFLERVDDLERVARAQSAQFRRQDSVRAWHTPESMAEADLLDVPNLHEPAWNRDKLNETYALDVAAASSDNRGTYGDIMALKTQIDFMAAEERAFRVRHATPVRCAAVAHGRLHGHGMSEHGVFSIVSKTADTLLVLGGFTGENE